MNRLKCLLVFTSLFGVIIFSSCEDETNPVKNNDPQNGLTIGQDKSFSISVSHAFGNDRLQYAPNKYFTLNDTIEVTELRYYLTNITLTPESGAPVNLGNYELIDIDPSALDIVIPLSNVPQGNYKRLSFFIGVDSIKNSSGVQEGALDPNLGMFWTWNTGYIFFKVRGRFSTNSSFALDVGGSSNLMSVSFDLSNFAPINKLSPEVAIQFDVEKLFNAPNRYNLGVDADQIHNSNNGSIPKLKANITNSFTLKGIK